MYHDLHSVVADEAEEYEDSHVEWVYSLEDEKC